MSKGHLDMRLNLGRKDELGEMAQAMDDFADILQNDLVASLQKLAQGDLTFVAEPVDGKDSIRGALKKVSDDLNDVIQRVFVAGNQVSAGAGQIADSNQSLSQGATEQASSLEEITSSVTEMASQTKMNSENASAADELTQGVRVTADRGNEHMQRLMTAMNDIDESGKSISKIIKVIDEIAFQTNLLALNAAVEAARAGQHGKGFAVVAEEVRNLAGRSAKAAQETAQLIESSVDKAENGAKIAEQTAHELKEIVIGVAKASDLISEITAASTEQSTGIAEINIALGQVDIVTQANTASAEEGAAAAEELSSQAHQLQEMLKHFKLRGFSDQSFAGSSMGSIPQLPATSPVAEYSAPGWDQSSSEIALGDSEFGKY